MRLHDTVVAQQVHWQPRYGTGQPFEIAPQAPTSSGGPLVHGQWRASSTVQIQPVEPTANGGELSGSDTWHWSNNQGVTVDLDLVPWRPARRTTGDSWGDVALLVLMLTLMVGVGQLNYLLRQLGAAIPTAETAYEPTPELIARLLKRDLDGHETGRPQRAERPEAQRQAPSFYLPAGHDGDLERAGGGSNLGDEAVRSPAQDASTPDTPALATKRKADDDVEVQPAAKPLTPDGPPEPQALDVDVALATPEESPSLAEPIERFIGWGFRDWFEVQDSREAQEEQIARILESTRVRLKINPDDPYAIQTAAYYAYLSENHELGSALHERFIELYPEDPSGYNNLALTHKRRGEYTQEEALYRRALALDPLDHHVINNLAVNLAHQGRFDEALRLMATLEELTPGDPYAELHRAKIFAAMGKKRLVYRSLKKALAHVDKLDTLHHIEFRQDIRLDPAFDKYRSKWGFKRLLRKEYGDDADALIGRDSKRWWQRKKVADG